MPVFGADAVEYSNFVEAFECLIESRTESSSSRLKPEEGYPEARKLLKQGYGQSYKIATACVDKVTKGPAIKSEDRKGFIAELCHLADKL